MLTYMVGLPPRAKQAVLLVLDAVLVPLALWAAYSLRLSEWYGGGDGYTPLAAVLVVASLPMFRHLGL